MKRGPSGEFVTISTVGEVCRAFVPNPLPPQPPLTWAADLQAQFAAAHTALGRLDGIASLLSGSKVFRHAQVKIKLAIAFQQIRLAGHRDWALLCDRFV